MKEWLVAKLVEILMEMVTPETVKKYGDKLFDFIEDAVTDSETKWDDRVVLPIIQAIRIAFQIPDND